MGRPQVQLTTENLLPQLRTHLNKQLPWLRAIPGIVGITLNGGMSRGYADHLSEVDVTLYLDEPAFQRYQQGLNPIPTGIVVIDGQLYDMKICSLMAEMESTWSDVACWDGSYAEVLYDPEGKVAELYAKQLAEPPKVAGAGGLLFDCWWHFHLACRIWIHRQDGLQAHLMLNRTIEPLVKALFLVNQEHVPHEKWLIHMSRTLAWRPERWEERLTAAMTIASPTVEAAEARHDTIAALWAEIDRYAVSNHFPGHPLPLMHRGFYDLVKWLVDRREMPLSDWTARAGGAMLSRAPFNACVTVEDGMVRIDRKRLAALGPADMDPWFYELVAALRDQNTV